MSTDRADRLEFAERLRALDSRDRKRLAQKMALSDGFVKRICENPRELAPWLRRQIAEFLKL